jgi:hypothetical protein
VDELLGFVIIKLPVVTGKAADVDPVTYGFPLESIAIPAPSEEFAR